MQITTNGPQCPQIQPSPQVPQRPAWPYRLLPFFYTLRTYGTKELLIDLPTGLTQAVLHIPQGMAYALLAGVEPINGLYVSFIPPLIYAFFSSTKHVSIGTFAVVSILCHAVLNKRGLISGNDSLPSNFSNITSSVAFQTNELPVLVEKLNSSTPPITPIEMLTTLSLLVGVIIFAMGLLRFGSFSRLLSTPLVSAFTCAAALHVASSQLPPIFGIAAHQVSGPFSLPFNMWTLAKVIPTRTNWSTFGFSTATFAILFTLRFILSPLCHRYTWIPNPPPVELFCIVLSAWVAYQFELSTKWNLSVLGDIPAGLPAFHPPRVQEIVDWPLFVDALLISFLITALTLSLVKLYAPEDYSSQPNRQLVALGMSNMLSCCFGCFPSAPSLSRSSVLRTAANCTPFANIYSSAILLLVLLYLGPLFATLPKCVLSCIILVALKGLLLQAIKFIHYVRNRRLEAFVWIFTYIPTVLFDLYIGFLCGISVSLLHLLFENFKLKSKQDDVSSDAEVEQIP